ncbi:hypothetical protein [Candidatus Oscillochloris fontis]|uniref:hypothetical protein n=1 Tax=Candidatus Oscillochloris fontis TaxID=2496868 RepID=UPI00101CAAD8|nr:hypothetical protein [Candidatus Oscillochloris fontis]
MYPSPHLVGLLLVTGTLFIHTQSNAILLAPAISEAEPALQARGIFYQQSHALDLPSRVRIASSPDGTGMLCTDDEVRLHFQPAQGALQMWQHLFADPEGHTIRCLPPQEIDLAAGAGRYTVTITLTDQFADTFSSSSYYLIPLYPPPTPSPTRSVASSQHSPTPTATILLPRSTPNQNTESGGSDLTRSLWWWVPVATLVFLILILRLRPQRITPPRFQGIIDLRDRETGEHRTILLHNYPAGVAITRQPLDCTPLRSPRSPPAASTCILPGPNGAVLSGETQPTPLIPGEVVMMSHLEIRMR